MSCPSLPIYIDSDLSLIRVHLSAYYPTILIEQSQSFPKYKYVCPLGLGDICYVVADSGIAIRVAKDLATPLVSAIRISKCSQK